MTPSRAMQSSLGKGSIQCDLTMKLVKYLNTSKEAAKVLQVCDVCHGMLSWQHCMPHQLDPQGLQHQRQPHSRQVVLDLPPALLANSCYSRPHSASCHSGDYSHAGIVAGLCERLKCVLLAQVVMLQAS